MTLVRICSAFLHPMEFQRLLQTNNTFRIVHPLRHLECDHARNHAAWWNYRDLSLTSAYDYISAEPNLRRSHPSHAHRSADS
jgi:hypothetical protein